MSQIIKESGNRLPMVSLGGVVSQPGKGRVIETKQYNASTPTIVQILLDNPKRISAIIQNLGPDTVGVYAGTLVLGTEAVIGLTLNGALQIDRDFPWTGPMLAASGGLSLVNVTEISVE